MLPKPGYIIDLGRLFAKTFGTKPYIVGKDESQPVEDNEYRITGSKSDEIVTPNGSLIATQVQGVEIWLPVRFFLADTLLQYLPYSVVRISGKKTIVKTPVMYRKGTIKEQYNIDDYSITIRGFVIGQDRKFPEKELDGLRQLYELKEAIQLDNALTNIFLKDPGLNRYEQQRVVIESLEFPEVEGGRKHVRPFSMQLESDSVFTLEVE